MRVKKVKKRGKHKKSGAEALAEPGVGAAFVRTSWMSKLNNKSKTKKDKKLEKYDKSKSKPT